MPRKKTFAEDPALIRASKVLAESTTSPVDLSADYACLADSYKALLRKFHKTLVISDTYQAQHQELSRKLEETTCKYRKLKDVALPICMYCKKIRSDDDYWQKLETFFNEHADIMFSHGICPECVNSAYNQMGLKKKIAPTVAHISASHNGREPDEDDALREMRAMVRQRAFDGTPLSPDVEQFVEKYGKLLRRFNKILSISDNYQSQLMELNTRLELMARTDLLTGLANRWEMVARLESEKSRSERHGKNFSVLIADIDLFKKINDTHGHLAGDRFIHAIAETFRTNIRSEDICGRWGGEEFLFILPETELGKAVQTAEKLLEKVRSTSIQWEGQKISVTMSIGCGFYRNGLSIDAFIREVDDALYSAKAAGRDRVALADL